LTTVVTEITELGSIFGYAGIVAALEALRDQPIKLFATVPPLVALLPHMEAIAPSLEEYRELLGRPEVVGLGELYWGPLIRGDERLLELVEATLEAGKVAEGHAAGCRGARFQAYAAAGISSDHEPITAEEGRERLELGQWFLSRNGEIRQDLPAYAPLWRDARLDLRRMALATDSVGAEWLLEKGSVDHNAREAIGLGLEPARAIQMVTLNVAEHFRLDHRLGAIAPGRDADLLLVEDERELRPLRVYSGGRLVAERGRLLVEPRPVTWPRGFAGSVRRRRLPRPDDLRVSADGAASRRVRLIECVSGLVTQEAEAELGPVDSELVADPAAGILKVAAFDRLLRTEARFVGFIRGYGLQRGAIATSMTWDAQCLVAIGATDRDMALAIDRLIDTQGGASVFVDGDLVAELIAPLWGTASRAPLPEIAETLAHLRRTLQQLGSPWSNPLLTADVLTTASIPFFRITDRGYVRLRTGEQVGLFAD
jgi:adenine deaminase